MQLIKRHDAQFLVVFIFSLPPVCFPLAFSCSYLSQLMRDDRIFREMGGPAPNSTGHLAQP
jgi:hypothetical protein